MKLGTLKSELDNLFEIDKYSPDLPFSKALPRLYAEKGIDPSLFFTKKFLRSFHGLMIENGSEINKVYGTVFLDRGVIDKIFKKNEKNVLIFSHHPMEDETAGAGFTALDLDYLEKMKKLNISVYVLHTPFEMNKEISVTGSVNSALGLRNVKYSKNRDYDFLLPYGELEEAVDFEEFIVGLKKLFGVRKINSLKKLDSVKKIAVLSGGATDINFIRRAMELKCDTFLTGEYYNKLKMPFGEEERRIFKKERKNININLIECSHYATEKLVFLREIPDLFNKLRIPYEFIEQNDPWY